MNQTTYTAREVTMAKLKIKCSWGVALFGAIMLQFSVSKWASVLDAIMGTLTCFYYLWCLFWIIEGSLGPFMKNHARLLIPAIAINLPTFGCMGCFIMVILFPIGIIAAMIIGVIFGAIMMATALVTIFWGCLGGGIYYYRKCRRIAMSVPVEPPPITADWYAHIDGQQVGPLTAAGLRDEIVRRGAEGTALIAKAGDQDWISFREWPFSQG
jgi:hypothetical protein